MTLSPISTLLLGVILGCAVTTIIHSLTVSCVQCGSSSGRSFVGLDKFSSIYTSNRFSVRQLGLIAGETNCATLRLEMETVKAMSSTNNRKRRNVDSTKGTIIVYIVIVA